MKSRNTIIAIALTSLLQYIYRLDYNELRNKASIAIWPWAVN